MATNFLEYSCGTNGWLTSPVTVMSTELGNGTGLASGSAATSSIAGPWSQSSFGSAQWCLAYFTWTTAFTPTAGGCLACWWLNSPDGGTNYETVVATASITVPALGRSPDFIIPLYEGGASLGNTAPLVKWCQAPFRYPWMTAKLLVQNLSGVALPATGNIIKIGSVADQY